MVNKTLECHGAEGRIAMAIFALLNWLAPSEAWCASYLRP